ncbi:competence type IV pilus major pilin ComGC [Companilactobacillus ginsenosidimutans]|uniref:Competence protein ComGC n=1 Tax=Companilactobacillus ginsenosidimutans TaxID=1007676 RepID=A0A0H4QIL6_9LACO|nr:prepilin-type N-terminal cleavage/methylation domain-containing protein [Companilactobacillus ginsenosidimutans]AKP68269.1 hypothetical protein ABM34_12470 [Companilactobacillus ginsenosidimutans]
MTKRKRKGFTLIEMVIVMFIISVLLMLVIPNVVEQRNNAEKHSADAFIRTVQTVVDMDSYGETPITTQSALLDKLTKDQKERFQKLNLIYDTTSRTVKVDSNGAKH